MPDTLFTILIVGGCALFLAIRAWRSFQGKGDGCGCGCAGGCSVPDAKTCPKPEGQIHLQQMPLGKKQGKEER